MALLESTVVGTNQPSPVNYRYPNDSSFDEALSAYAMTRDHAVTEVHVRAGETVDLRDLAVAQLAQTADVTQFKAWIGVPDEWIERQELEGLPEIPTAPWTKTDATAVEQLTEEEWANVQLAAKAYLFGHSALVSSYAPAIELFFGPFAADVYVIPRLVIEEGATLTVSGRPAALLIEDLEIHEGGRWNLQTILRIHVQSLRKVTVAY
jgi:hypothetical protein